MQANSGGFRPPTPAGVALAGPEPDEDPRLVEFRRFIQAVDSGSYRDGAAATQALRRYGVSVVLTKPIQSRGGQHGA